MRVLFTQQRLWPALGGGEIGIYRLGRALADLGVEVTILTTNLDSTDGRRRLSAGTERQGKLTIVRRRPLVFHPYLVVTPHMVTDIARADTEIIHAHGYGYWHSELSAHLSRIRKTPLILSTHGYFPASIGSLQAAGALYDRIGTRTLLRQARAILVDSVAEKQFYDCLADPGKIQVLPGESLLEESVHTIWDPAVFRDAFSLDEPFIFGIGRLTRAKGFQYLIRAFARHIARSGDVTTQLVIAGPDEGYRAELQRLVSETDLGPRVHFVGTISEPLKFSALAGSVCLAVPSVYETYGIVISEGMAVGTPIVATRNGGVTPRLVPGINGVLMDPTQEEELEAGLTWALTLDSAERRRIREFSQARILEGYTVEAAARQLLSVYDSVLSRPSRGSS